MTAVISSVEPPEPAPPVLGARDQAIVAALFFALVGGSLVAYAIVSRNGFWLPGVAALVIAAVLPLLPWDRWSPATTMWIAVAALALMLLSGQLEFWRSREIVVGYPLVVIVVLTWVGFTQPRRTALYLTLCAGAVLGYLLLLALPVLPWTTLLALPLGAVLGEGLSWLATNLRRERSREVLRAEHLRNLRESFDQLHRRDTIDGAAELIARLARSVYGADKASVEVLIDGAPAPGTSRSTAALVRHVLAGEAASPPGCEAHVLVGAEAPVAVLLIGGVEAPTDEFEQQVRSLFLSQAGATLEHFARVQTLAKAARIDALTGMGNRRHAGALLDGLVAGDAVLLIDLDKFKAVNDTDGHMAGDDLLQALSGYLRSYVRDTDNMARYGGDEFIVVARGAGVDAGTAAERLMDGWRSLKPRATISIGVAIHDPVRSGAATLGRADDALYAAKQAGRDRVAVAPPSADKPAPVLPGS